MHLLHCTHIYCNTVPFDFIVFITKWAIAVAKLVHDDGEAWRWSLIQDLGLYA